VLASSVSLKLSSRDLGADKSNRSDVADLLAHLLAALVWSRARIHLICCHDRLSSVLVDCQDDGDSLLIPVSTAELESMKSMAIRANDRYECLSRRAQAIVREWAATGGYATAPVTREYHRAASPPRGDPSSAADSVRPGTTIAEERESRLDTPKLPRQSMDAGSSSYSTLFSADVDSDLVGAAQSQVIARYRGLMDETAKRRER
jgi:hypothetical protein